MIKITIAYPRVTGRAFDHDYFFNRHLPRFLDLAGAAVTRVTVERGVDAPAWPHAHHEAICSLECETREAFEAAFFPHIEDLQDDMERCGGAAPTIQITEIVLDRATREAPPRRQDARLHRLCPPARGGNLAIATAGSGDEGFSERTGQRRAFPAVGRGTLLAPDGRTSPVRRLHPGGACRRDERREARDRHRGTDRPVR